VVPDLATLWYFVHAPDRAGVEEIRGRIASLAEESARRTGTEVELQLLSSTSHWLINRRVSEHLQTRLEGDVLPLSFGDEPVLISDDTAEASWVVPRGGFLVRAFPAGTPSHSREWVEAGRSELAHEAMMRAARALAASAVDLLVDRKLLEEVRDEFESATKGKPYVSPLPPGLGPFHYFKVEN
jgi:metal-dependent amidase/aminoacylase/carboxypeptidase family protein